MTSLHPGYFEQMLKDDDRLVAEWREAGHATALDAAAHRASGTAKQVEFGTGAWRQPRW